MSKIGLEAKTREEKGKNAIKVLRKDGLLPAVLYGQKKDPVTIKVYERELEKLISREGTNVVMNLKIDESSEENLAMIKEIQYETLSNKILHIDFVRISLDTRVQINVPVNLMNADVIKKQGGIIQQILGQIKLECFPDNIPEELVIDMSDYEVGSTVKISDIKITEGVEVLADGNDAVVTILAPKADKKTDEGEAPEDADAEGSAAEGDSAEEGGEGSSDN